MLVPEAHEMGPGDDMIRITAQDHPGTERLEPVTGIARGERLRLVRALRVALGGLDGRQVAVLGAAFEVAPDESSVSPGLEVASLLMREGASVAIYDPVVPPSRILQHVPDAVVAGAFLDAARNADAVVVAIDWIEFRKMDLAALRRVVSRPVLADAAHCIDARQAERAGFTCVSVGGASQALSRANSPGRPAASTSSTRTPWALLM